MFLNILGLNRIKYTKNVKLQRVCLFTVHYTLAVLLLAVCGLYAFHEICSLSDCVSYYQQFKALPSISQPTLCPSCLFISQQFLKFVHFHDFEFWVCINYRNCCEQVKLDSKFRQTLIFVSLFLIHIDSQWWTFIHQVNCLPSQSQNFTPFLKSVWHF